MKTGACSRYRQAELADGRMPQARSGGTGGRARACRHGSGAGAHAGVGHGKEDGRTGRRGRAAGMAIWYGRMQQTRLKVGASAEGTDRLAGGWTDGRGLQARLDKDACCKHGKRSR